MNSFKIVNRQVAFFAVVAALLLSVVLPAIASAAQLTERSVQLSSASAGAKAVSYTVKFTPAEDAGAVVVDFCGNSPLVGQTCATATGFSATAATTATAGFTRTVVDANTIVLYGTDVIKAGEEVSVQIDNIDNPTTAGALYARIVTYNNETNAATYASEDTAEQDTDRIDEGGAAFWILNSIGVSAAVMESMTFCVSNAVIAASCGNPGTPTLKLGEPVGDVLALSPTAVSEGTMWTQISTNAAKGAVISLKSSALNCGGLVRLGGVAGNCDIKPATAGITQGNALFGVKTGTAAPAAGVTGDAGTLQPVVASGYSPSTFLLNYNPVGNATGVTSAFGDPFLDTDGAPADSINMQLTFGASASNNTPAGQYSADLSLIATGKF
jgi:hypothetical protein